VKSYITSTTLLAF